MNIDADINNADWAKRTWDVFTSDGELVSTLDQLRSTFPDQSDAQLKAWLKLPSGQNMPQPLKGQLAAL